MTDARTITIGTRGSRLALVQAHRIARLLRGRNPGCAFTVRTVVTDGDCVSDWAQVRDETGIFVKELESALCGGEIDMAVHCVKDMPSQEAQGLVLAGVPGREDPRDALVANGGTKLDELPRGATVGASSIRRAAWLRRRRGDLTIVALRGNVDTRVRKLREGAAAATVLAAAGLIRLGLESLITEYLDAAWMPPAPCQGALGIEVREDDAFARALAEGINDREASDCVAAERAFLRRLGAGCRVPVSALAAIQDGEIRMSGSIIDGESLQVVEGAERGARAGAATLGVRLAERLLAAGGDRMLERMRTNT